MKAGEWLAKHRTMIMVAVMLGVTGLAIAALHALSKEVRLHDIRAAFHLITLWHAAAALVLTAASYLALTFYDYVALRVIHRPLPWRTAAMASFCSYTLSHNLGLSLLTGGSARYRIYTAEGLEAGDIARIIASASLSFWGGVIVMAGLLMAVHPEPIALGGFSFAVSTQRVVGVLILLAAVATLFAIGRTHRAPRIFGWTIGLPTRGQAVAQILVASLDLAAASAALYVLVPGVEPSLYPTFFLGYALAIIIALVSHVPGGIGIFEAVIVATLPTVDRPALLAALIAYRLIYYLLPLFLGIALIVLREGHAWRAPMGRALGGAQSVAARLAPFLLSILVAVSGFVLLISSALPALPSRMRDMNSVLPIAFIEVSHLAASLIGTLLLLLASGLYRRLDSAFWLTRALLLAGAIFSIAKGLDYEEAVILLVVACLLQWTREAFYRRTRLTADMLTPTWLATVAIAIGLSTWIGFFAYKHVDYSNDLWWSFGAHADASRFLRGALVSGVLVIAVAIWRLERPAALTRPTGSDVARPRSR